MRNALVISLVCTFFINVHTTFASDRLDNNSNHYSQITCDSTDVYPDYGSLLTLFDATDGQNWFKTDGWGQNCNYCNWFGVRCNNANKVIAINLNQNNLVGNIPPNLARLTNLEVLLLSSNRLTGEIPAELAIIEPLRVLHLYNNDLSGCIPSQLDSLCGDNVRVENNPCLSHNADFASFCAGDTCMAPDLDACRTCDDGILNQDEIAIDCGGTKCLPCHPCPDIREDYDALMALYNSTDGDNWKKNTGWGEGCNVCSWYGVGCNSDNQITSLILPNNRLSGEIPSEIGNLSQLRNLFLDYNNLGGSIPESISNLSSLQFLVINNNNISGEIPSSIGTLSELIWFLAEKNNLTGIIPDSIVHLQNLEFLNLSRNDLGGEIPNDIGLLGSIKNLYLNDNSLIGCFPESMEAFCDLDINIADNICLSHGSDFASFCAGDSCIVPAIAGCGTCEDGIKNQNEEGVDCGGTCLPCALCSDVDDYNALMAVYNSMDGENWTVNTGWGIDCDICEWYGIECNESGRVDALFLFNNQLKNSIPKEINELDSLTALFLNYNEITGSIPSEIGQLKKLQVLSLNNNMISGEIPAEMTNLESIVWLILNNNMLTGSIPGGLSNLESINQLLLNSNQLSGEIPESLSELTTITNLYLNNNELTGCIPESFRDFCGKDIKVNGNPCLSQSEDLRSFCSGVSCTSLITRDCNSCGPDFNPLMAIYEASRGPSWYNNDGWGEDCDYCDWYGVQCDTMGRVQLLFLSGNGLSGTLPSAISELDQISAIFLDQNGLKGKIPATIGDLTNLEVLSARDNQLIGEIPSTFRNLKSLKWLLLEFNELFGSIPSELGELTDINQILLNNNKLTGEIPASLGNLTQVTNLHLNNNNLSGCIPDELSIYCGRDLRIYNNTCLSHNDDLRAYCAGEECSLPAIAGCGACDDGILNQDEEGIDCGGSLCEPCPPCQDVIDYEPLMALYNATGGDEWTNKSGWGEDCEICNWHGILCDSTKRITRINLADNNLVDSLPSEISDLDQLIALILDFNQLGGMIPGELAKLKQLEFLILSNNELSGNIPTELNQLDQLRWLILNDNELNGEIPSGLSKLSELSQMLLHNNNLTGSIPTTLADIPKINNMYLYNNNLYGCIPESFRDLCGKDIKLHDNQCLSHNAEFTSFCNSTGCEVPALEGCGTCDDGIQNQNEIAIDCGGACKACAPCHDVEDYSALMALYDSTDGRNWIINQGWGEDCNICDWYGIDCDADGRVININLTDNRLSGVLPSDLGELTMLQNLTLDFNQVNGVIPIEIGQLINIKNLFLNHNQLSGSIPPTIGNLNKLEWLTLKENALSGEIPTELGSILSLVNVELSVNQLEGSIPGELANLSSLINLDLSNNMLSGCIPEAIQALCRQDVNLEKNDCLSHDADFIKFCETPQCNYMEVCDCTNPDPQRAALMDLYYGTNGDSWTNKEGWSTECNICDWYGVTCNDQGQIIDLTLSGNNLSGDLPASITTLSSIEFLDLSSNSITGSIPSDIDAMAELTFLYLNNNKLSDSIPTSIGALHLVRDLQIGNNELSGSIPSAINQLANLYYLNLSENEISGEIPAEMGSIATLFDLDLHNNRLGGCIPENMLNLCNKTVDLNGNECLSHSGDFSSFCRDITCDIDEINLCVTCNDGVKNNEEEEVDCGGSCTPCINSIIGNRKKSRKQLNSPQIDIAAFPNPVSNLLYIEIPNDMDGTLRITNASGKIYYHKTEVQHHTRIDVSDYDPGLYFIIIKTSEGNVVKKVVKE